MKGYPQFLADIFGRLAAIFLKAQLYFLAWERQRLERRYGVTNKELVTEPLIGTPTLAYFPTRQPRRRRSALSACRSTDHVA